MSNETSPDTTSAAPTQVPGNTQTLIIIMAVATICIIYIALSHLVGIDNYWPGFLFLLFWGGVEKLALGKLPECIVGAFLGTFMGYLLNTLPPLMGASGFALFILLICALVFCQIKRWLAIAVNLATMLFITVTAIPFIQQHAEFTEIFMALAFGALFFGAIGWLVHKIMSRKAAQQQTD